MLISSFLKRKSKMRNQKLILFGIAIFIISAVTAFAAEPDQQLDLGKATEKILNPISDVWSFNFEYDLLIMEGNITDDRRLSNILTFKPVISFPLGVDWNLINRPTLQLPIEETLQSDGTWRRDSGFGDMALAQVISPERGIGQINIIGAGWTWIFPTASDDTLGQGKCQLGPAVAIGSITDKYQVAAVFQQWWSIGGDDERNYTSSMSLEYWLQWRVNPTFTVGMNPTITADWTADLDERWTVPVGLGFSKTINIGNIPVNFSVEADYSIVRPKSFGQEWDINFTITPAIPNPFKHR